MKQKGQYFIYKQPILHCECIVACAIPSLLGLIHSTASRSSFHHIPNGCSTSPGRSQRWGHCCCIIFGDHLEIPRGTIGTIGTTTGSMGQWESRKLGRVPSGLFDIALENHHVQLKINTAIDTAIDTCSSGYLIQLFDTCLIKINHWSKRVVFHSYVTSSIMFNYPSLILQNIDNPSLISHLSSEPDLGSWKSCCILGRELGWIRHCSILTHTISYILYNII